MKQDFITALAEEETYLERAQAFTLVAKAFRDQEGLLTLVDAVVVALLGEPTFAGEADNREYLRTLVPLIAAYREDRLRLSRLVTQVAAR